MNILVHPLNVPYELCIMSSHYYDKWWFHLFVAFPKIKINYKRRMELVDLMSSHCGCCLLEHICQNNLTNTDNNNNNIQLKLWSFFTTLFKIGWLQQTTQRRPIFYTRKKLHDQDMGCVPLCKQYKLQMTSEMTRTIYFTACVLLLWKYLTSKYLGHSN